MNVVRRTQNLVVSKLVNILQVNNFQNRSGFLIKAYQKNSRLHIISCYATKTSPGSRFHPISPLELTEIKLRETFFTKNHFTTEEWAVIKDDLMTDFVVITEENFDSILMNSLLSLNNIQLSRSFMEYLNAISHKPNFVTYLKYMVLCSRHPNICKQDEILDLFEKIRPVVDSMPVLDKSTINCVVHGLCATDQWRKSFDYLEKLAEKGPLLETKNVLVSAASRNGNEYVAWDIMSTWYRSVEVPSVNAINDYIRFASTISDKNLQLADKYFSKLLIYLKSKNIIMKSECVEEVKRYFERHPSNWTISSAKINRLGCCPSCHGNLESAHLSAEELNLLKTVFFDKVIKKTDIYINSSRSEINKFLDYVQRHEPFDIVVDGMNAAHSLEDFKIPKTLAIQLLKVVKRLTVTSQRVLILGRKHMYRWPRNIMDSIRSRASMFFTNNVSEDDPFVIYAALNSGPNTLFVSSDLMRDHVSNIDDPKMIQLFHKWQQSHQIYLSASENGPTFKGPLKHHISIQGNMEEGWHIPYDDEFVLDPYEELNNWLCIQRINE